MKKTLLELVQDLLSDMDSDEVNSISDTVESLQVATAFKNTYWYLQSTNVFPEHKDNFTLTGLGNTNKPSHMQVPSDVGEVDWIRYDISTGSDIIYREVDYRTPTEFIDYVSKRDSTSSAVQTVTEDSGVKLLIRNDQAPQYYTSFDDEYIVFDGFDSDEDSTLQTSKSMGWGTKIPTFSLTDSFVPDLDEHLFPLLYEETKSQVFLDLKQMPNQKAEQRSRKILTQHQQKENKLGNETRYIGPNYGRN